jgi:hypothetical protein
MHEKLKAHWSVQPEFQTAASYRKIHISQTVEAMRLKFYEHAHKVISNNFGIHSTAQFRTYRGSNCPLHTAASRPQHSTSRLNYNTLA